jgi:hypothetical protein
MVSTVVAPTKRFIANFNIRYIFRHKTSPLGRKHDIHQGLIPGILEAMTLSFDYRGEIYIGNEMRQTHYTNLIGIGNSPLTNHVIITLGHTDGSEFDIYIETENMEHVRRLRSPNNYN